MRVFCTGGGSSIGDQDKFCRRGLLPDRRTVGYRLEIVGCEAEIQRGATPKYKVLAYSITRPKPG